MLIKKINKIIEHLKLVQQNIFDLNLKLIRIIIYNNNKCNYKNITLIMYSII